VLTTGILLSNSTVWKGRAVESLSHSWTAILRNRHAVVTLWRFAR